MAATIFFCQDYGVRTGNIGQQYFRGSGRTTGEANWNWKNIDSPSSLALYSDYPITAGNRSFSQYGFIVFSGGYNMITGVTYQHTGTDLGIGLSVSGFISGSGFYATPSTSLPTLFTMDFTATGGAARTVLVGPGGPEISGKGLSSTAIPSFTEYVGHQLATLSSANPGDSTGIYYHSYAYVEN